MHKRCKPKYSILWMSSLRIKNIMQKERINKQLKQSTWKSQSPRTRSHSWVIGSRLLPENAWKLALQVVEAFYWDRDLGFIAEARTLFIVPKPSQLRKTLKICLGPPTIAHIIIVCAPLTILAQSLNDWEGNRSRRDQGSIVWDILSTSYRQCATKTPSPIYYVSNLLASAKHDTAC